MSSRTMGKNFFEAHWDWLVALGGLSLAGLSFALNFLLAEEVQPVVLTAGAGEKVDAVDLAPYTAVMDRFNTTCQLAAIDGDKASFLAPGYRVWCAPGDPEKKGCGMPIAFGSEKCPFCGVNQKAEETPTEDQDGDNMPDAYEKEHGLNPTENDADLDKDDDGFTNFEEFQAGTDPSDPKSHPEYLPLFVLDKELVQTYTTLMFSDPLSQTKLRFYDPTFKKEFNSGIFQVDVGKEINYTDPKGKVVSTGYLLKEYVPKTEKRKIGNGMERTDIVSEAVLERVKDGKRIVLVKDRKRTPTDFQATLIFDRIESKGEQKFTVQEGDEIEVNGCKYKVEAIKKTAKSHSVKLTSLATGESRVIEPLE